MLETRLLISRNLFVDCVKSKEVTERVHQLARCDNATGIEYTHRGGRWIQNDSDEFFDASGKTIDCSDDEGSEGNSDIEYNDATMCTDDKGAKSNGAVEKDSGEDRETLDSRSERKAKYGRQ